MNPFSGLSRREFLRASAGGFAAATIFGAGFAPLSANVLGLPAGLQLYTVKDELAKDFDGTLQKVAAIGYKEVEAAGFYNKTAAEFRKSIESAGLTLPAAHYSLEELLQGLDAKLAFAHELGLKYIVCSFPFVANPGRFHADKYYEEIRAGITLDDWKWNADQFNKVGEKAKKAGMQFAYHNHNLEFRKEKGLIAFDELLRQTDAKLVKMEMDIGWVASTGNDPAAYLEKYPNRFELLHVKDIRPGTPSTEGEGTGSTELGRGTIDWKKVFAAAKRASVKHYFIEQEDPFLNMPVMEAIKVDYEFVSKQ
jgi:sugar phosphate isomerase/epimerase